MVQTDNPQGSKPTPQSQSDPKPPVIYRSWPIAVTVVGLLLVGAGGIAVFICLSYRITDAIIAARYNFAAQNGLSLFIFLAVVAQAIIYFSQRNLMKEQWLAMREASIAATEAAEDAKQINIYAQRAYVVAKIRGTSKDSTHLQFRLRIVNTGNTPANNVWVYYSHGLRKEPPHQETPEKWTETSRNIVVFDAGLTESERLGLIAPISSYHVIETPMSGPLTGDQHQEWKLGNLKYYCWGRIDYDTIFEQGRYSAFCFYQSFEKPNGYPCKHGNEAI